MVVVRDRHTEGDMMITDHDHHTTVTKHRFPTVAVSVGTVSQSQRQRDELITKMIQGDPHAQKLGRFEVWGSASTH